MKIYDETESISQGSAFAAIDSDKAYIQKKAKKEFKAIFAIVSKQILKNIEFQIEDNWLFKQKGRCNASAFLFWFFIMITINIFQEFLHIYAHEHKIQKKINAHET